MLSKASDRFYLFCLDLRVGLKMSLLSTPFSLNVTGFSLVLEVEDFFLFFPRKIYFSFFFSFSTHLSLSRQRGK